MVTGNDSISKEKEAGVSNLVDNKAWDSVWTKVNGPVNRLIYFSVNISIRCSGSIYISSTDFTPTLKYEFYTK